MRNSGLIASLVALSLLGSMARAQESAIKVDTDATKASRQSARTNAATDNSSSANEKSTTPKASTAATKSIFEQSEPVVVAKWDDGEITNLEVSSTLETKRPANLRTLTPQQFAMLPRTQQVDVIKHLAWEQILLKEAREAGITAEHPQVAPVVTAQEESLLNRLYYEQHVLPELDELTSHNARELYEEKKDTEFTQPARTVVRVLHVSTYEMVTAEEGDTLTELASEISGDPDKAALIREARPPYFQRQIPTEIEDKVLSSPLEGGEVLFVPMGEDAVSSATALAENLREQLAAGSSLDTIVEQTSDEDFPVSATEPILMNAQAGYWEELHDATSELDETSVSEIVRTPTGLNIIKLEDRVTTQVVPFESVKENLESQVVADETTRRETVEEARNRILERLREKYELNINTEAISRQNYLGADPLSTSTVIASVGDDFKYTLDQYLTDLRLTGKDWGQLTQQERMDVLKVAPSITNYLIAREAREIGLHETDEFEKKMEDIIESQIVAVYKRQQQDPEDRHVTDAELRAFYDDHLDNYTSAAQVTVRELSKRINMTLTPAQKAEDVKEARASLEEIRSRIKSEEDFAQLARRESEAISTRSRGGLIGTVPEDFRGEAFKNQVRQLEEGEVSEPFLYGSEVMIIRLDDRLAPTVQPFEQVRREVMRDYAATMPQKMKNQEMEQALEKANFQIKF